MQTPAGSVNCDEPSACKIRNKFLFPVTIPALIAEFIP